jgi:hypothetical protein
VLVLIFFRKDLLNEAVYKPIVGFELVLMGLRIILYQIEPGTNISLSNFEIACDKALFIIRNIIHKAAIYILNKLIIFINVQIPHKILNKKCRKLDSKYQFMDPARLRLSFFPKLL